MPAPRISLLDFSKFGQREVGDDLIADDSTISRLFFSEQSCSPYKLSEPKYTKFERFPH